mgnify:CR=1 FL=1
MAAISLAVSQGHAPVPAEPAPHAVMLRAPPRLSTRMILPAYRVAPSLIQGAGKGLFLDEAVAAGRIIVAPDAIPRVYRWEELMQLTDAEDLLAATVRWFEDRYTVTPEWPDECYINHAFEPSALWHLGFVFARRDLVAGEEITVDYRHLLGPGQEESFRDALSGRAIVGYAWDESLRLSSAELAALLASAAEPG